jgi:hypothetical protein
MSSVCVGVDPGVSGAIAFIACDTGLVLEVADMPLYEGPRGDEVDTRQLGDLLCKYHARRIVIEDVHGIPGNGAKSLFNFGRAYGALLGTLWYCRLPFIRVRPQVWQAATFPLAGITEQHDTKKASVWVASKLHPEAVLVKPRGRLPSHDRADSVCIAHHAYLA